MSLLLLGVIVVLVIVVIYIIMLVQKNAESTYKPDNSVTPTKLVLPGRPQDCKKSCKFYETAIWTPSGCYCAPTPCSGNRKSENFECVSGLECVAGKCQLPECTVGLSVCPFGMSCKGTSGTKSQCDFDIYSITGFPNNSYNRDYVLASDLVFPNSVFQGFVPTTQQNIPGVPINDMGFVTAYPIDPANTSYPNERFINFGKDLPIEINSLQYGKGKDIVNRTIAGIDATGPFVTVTKKSQN
jgi:hypothetical protein